MAILLAINDRQETSFRTPPHRGWVSAKCVKEPQERAERAIGGFDIVAGVTLGVLWHVLFTSPA